MFGIGNKGGCTSRTTAQEIGRKRSIMEFGFRIIVCSNGTEIIDRNKTTSYSELTPVQMVEYTEIDAQLYLMDRMERSAREEMERRRKIVTNPFYRIAALCGLV